MLYAYIISIEKKQSVTLSQKEKIALVRHTKFVIITAAKRDLKGLQDRLTFVGNKDKIGNIVDASRKEE